MSRKNKKAGTVVLTVLVCVIILAVAFFPLYTLLNVSLREYRDLSSRLVPTANPMWDNYKQILSDKPFWKALFNTSLLFVMETVILIPISSISGYALARTKGRFVNMLRSFNILLMMIPQTALLVGTYMLMTKLHLTNSIVGLALLGAGGGMTGSMFFYTTFTTMIPSDLDDAAAIDGAGVLRTYFQIIMPQMKAVTVTRVITVLVGCWNSYLMPVYMLTNSEKFTLLLYVRKLFTGSATVPNIPLAFAGCVLMIMPILCLYFVLQKHIIGSQLDSAVKG